MADKIRISLEFGYSNFFAHNSYGTVDPGDIDWEELKEEQRELIVQRYSVNEKELKQLRADIEEEGIWYLVEWGIIEIQGSCEGRRCWAQGYWEEELEMEDWKKELKANPDLLKQLKALGMKVVKFSEEEEL